MTQAADHAPPTDDSGTTDSDIRRVLDYGNRLLDHLQGRWPTQISVRYPRPLTVVYASYPYWFIEAFPGLEDQDVRRLAVALRLVADSVCVTDTICDLEEQDDIVRNLLTVQAIQFEGYQILYSMFPPHVPFWSHFQQDMSEWMAAISLEAEAMRSVSDKDETKCAVLDRIAKGKAAMAKTVISGLVALSGDSTLLDTLRRSVEHCHLGVQLLDDLTDWRADLTRGVPSHVVTTLLRTRPDLAEARRTDDVLDAFARELYYGRAAFDTIERAVRELDKAMNLTRHLPTRRWHARILRCRERSKRLARDLTNIVHSRRTTRPAPPLTFTRGNGGEFEEAMQDGLSFLANEQASGFGEARHHLSYPWEFDPLGEKEPQACDTYQRALVLQGLAELRALAPKTVDQMIRTEVAHLLRSQCPVTGTWSYFPSVDELVVSTDVAAQVVIALHVVNTEGVQPLRATKMAVQSVLSRCGHADGSFLNWSLCDTWPPAEHIAATLTLDYGWLNATDVEVAASTAIAMSLEDPRGLRRRINETVHWVAEQQRIGGNWCGHCLYSHEAYSTFVCVQALRTAAEYRGMLARVRSSLIRKFELNLAGGDRTSAFRIALNLLTLAELFKTGKPDEDQRMKQRIVQYSRRAGHHLLSVQREDGSWPSTSFLRIGRMGFAQTTFEYGSRTVTTAFVLRALQRRRLLDLDGYDQ